MPCGFQQVLHRAADELQRVGEVLLHEAAQLDLNRLALARLRRQLIELEVMPALVGPVQVLEIEVSQGPQV